MKKIGLSLVLIMLSTQLLSENENARISRQMGGSSSVSVLGDTTQKKKYEGSVHNYQEVIYEHLEENDKSENRIGIAKIDKKFANDNVAFYYERLERERREEREALQLETNKNSSPVFASGYCYVDNEIILERMAAYAYFSCDFKEPIGKATLAVSLMPDFYAKAVIATPQYIEKNEMRFPVRSGVVLTKDKNSINIANLINDRKVEKLLALGTYTSLSIATKTAQSYLAMKINASQQQQVDTIASSGGTSTIQTTNTNEVPIENYIISGVIELVSSLSKVIGESVINELPFTFKIYKDSILFVDVQLDDNQNLLGIRATSPDGLIIKEPVFKLEDGSFGSSKSLNINARETEVERKSQ